MYMTYMYSHNVYYMHKHNVYVLGMRVEATSYTYCSLVH